MEKLKSHYRAVFMSDLHIGSPGAKVDEILVFLKSITCDYLYLVGDILDIMSMRRRVVWPDTAGEIVRRILKMISQGTQVIYITGNHDEDLREFSPVNIGSNILITDQSVYTSLSGDRVMVIHGDKFDFAVKHAKWLTNLGSYLYDHLVVMNTYLHYIRRKAGFRTHWSLSAYLKRQAKQAVDFVNHFALAACRYAQDNDCATVICGHIHTPALYLEDSTGVLYINCGDFVESLTAVVENSNGHLQLINIHPSY